MIEGGRDPANMILRQRRLKVRRTEKRSSEPRKNGKVETSKILIGHEELNHKKKHHGKKLSQPLNERWESYWESKRLYKPSSSFRPDKSYTGDRELPAKVETPQDHKNVTNSVEKKRSLRLEGTYPGTKATGLIKKTERKDKVYEAEPNVLPPLLLLPILKQIGSKAIKIRRLEAPAPFRRNTKAILKVRLAEKPKRKENINSFVNSTNQAVPSKHTLAHTAPITVDLPNITTRKRKIKRVKKRRKKSNETPEHYLKNERRRNSISSSRKNKIVRVLSPQIQQTNNTSSREGKRLRKEEVNKDGSGDSGQRSIPRLQTEEGRKLLNSVRRALLAAYAMAVATTGTTTTHYRGGNVSLGSA